jgi:putative flippase GtrA
VVGFFVQTGALWLLVSVGNVPHLAATAMAVETAVVHNFICHRCWTWSDRAVSRREWLGRLLLFNATNGAVSLFVNVASMALLQGALGLHYLVANLVGVACGSVVNFVLGDRVVFAGREDGQGRRPRPAFPGSVPGSHPETSETRHFRM